MDSRFSEQEIEVIVSKEAYLKPETVVFSAILRYENQKSLDKNLKADQQMLLDFFTDNQIEVLKTLESEASFGDFIYKTPAYSVLINYKQYLLLEKYRDAHKEVGGMAIKPVFFKKDKDQLLSDLTVDAWREADEIAIKKGLVLKSEYETEEIVEKKSGWVTGLPASARYDSFTQLLSATYKFTFKTL